MGFFNTKIEKKRNRMSSYHQQVLLHILWLKRKFQLSNKNIESNCIVLSFVCVYVHFNNEHTLRCVGGFQFIFVFNEPLSILNTVAIYVIYC